MRNKQSSEMDVTIEQPGQTHPDGWAATITIRSDCDPTKYYTCIAASKDDAVKGAMDMVKTGRRSHGA